nr:RHS repeat-associated core domain-containing protein [Xenorhabdus bovienii]
MRAGELQTQYAVCAPTGEPLALFDPKGHRVWRQPAHSLYGLCLKALGENAQFDPGLKFAGQYEDEESGLYYNRFRYYNPETAQYLSPDPIGLLGGFNPYGYVYNPTNWIDPLGLAGGVGNKGDAGVGGSVTVFRVQGGAPPNASYHRIKIDKDGNPKIQNATLNISIGDTKHAEHFKKIRGDDAELVSFEIPKWLDDFIKENAIKQKGYKTNPLNQGKLAPKIVDPSTPGDSYELPGIWTKWLEENAIPGSGKVKK